jgi:hypothetical protein
MNAKHLETLAETLAALKPLHTRIVAVGDELQQAYDDQSGEWRWSGEGDAAGEEIGTIEEIASGLEDAIEELRKFVFLLSENPDFAEMMSKGPRPKTGGKIAPLPDKPPDPAVARAKPRRPGAPPYPFLKRPNED